MSSKTVHNVTPIRVPRLSRLLEKKRLLELEAARIKGELLEIDNEIKAQVHSGEPVPSKVQDHYVKVMHEVSYRMVFDTKKLKAYLATAGLLKRFQRKATVNTLSVVAIERDEWLALRAHRNDV